VCLGLVSKASVQNTGNLISSGKGQTINYTGFNKVYNISDTVGTDCYKSDFIYGPDQQRWKTTLTKNSNIVKTILFAGDYEKVTANGITQELYYIGDKVLYVKQAGQPDKIYCLIKDHLGSIVKIIDNAGATVFAANYDAWGQQTVTNNTFAFHRGFTGHEHLPEFNLINMNGRMYDPTLGRFLSPDPFVQAPDFSQNFNRYSYCFNNPLKYTDPSGEWTGWDDLAAILIGGSINLITNWHKGMTFVEGLSYFLVGAAAGEATLYAPESYALIAGGASAANSVLQQGFASDWQKVNAGQVLFSGIMGAGTAYLGGQIGQGLGVDKWFKGVDNKLLRNWLQSTTTNAIVGGALNGTFAELDDDPNTNFWGGAWNGVKMGFVTGTISAIGNTAQYAIENKVNFLTGHKNALTNDELVYNAGAKANDAISGKGAVAGREKHEYAEKLVERYQKIYGDRGLETEYYFQDKGYGAGRLDVFNLKTGSTIYEYKFGYPNTTIPQFMNTPQIIKYQNTYPNARIIIWKF